MAIRITSDCIICSACLPECPNTAIYEPGTAWNPADGTSVHQPLRLMDGSFSDAVTRHAPLSNDYYYIVPDKCTECQGFHNEPQCASVCPIDVCVPDERYQEAVAELTLKKEKLHGGT